MLLLLLLRSPDEIGVLQQPARQVREGLQEGVAEFKQAAHLMLEFLQARKGER